MENERIGVVGIVVENTDSAEPLNAILHEHAECIAGRMGLPYRKRGVSVISLIVDGDADKISAMTGRLGRLPGVTVKSALVRAANPEAQDHQNI